MGANRWRRFADWDERPLRLDRFAVEDAESGFAAFNSPHDPKPGIAVADGRVVQLDGVAEADFDMIDTFIARYHIDVDVAVEAMAVPSPAWQWAASSATGLPFDLDRSPSRGAAG